MHTHVRLVCEISYRLVSYPSLACFHDNVCVIESRKRVLLSCEVRGPEQTQMCFSVFLHINVYGGTLLYQAPSRRPDVDGIAYYRQYVFDNPAAKKSTYLIFIKDRQ